MLTRDEQGLHPYYPISRFYREKFGAKVYKIPVSIVDDCPNRRGLKGMQTCVFCDPWGSAARAESFEMELRQQIETFRDRIFELYKAEKFLVYFQAYTNTFAKFQTIKGHFETALSYPFVKGLVVGTRPDCLSKSVLDLWREYNEKTFLSVEMGVQTFNDKHLEFLRRGHTAEDSIKAIQRIKETTGVDLGIHFIFGLPGETEADVIANAEMANSLPIDNVKLHNLHVLKNTPLEEIYQRGEFQPLELEQYADRVKLFLQHLNPKIAVHRLTALSSRKEELIAPSWTAEKMRPFQFCIDHMKRSEAFQGQLFSASH